MDSYDGSAEAQEFANKGMVVEQLIRTLKEVLPEPPLRNQPLQAEFAETTIKRSKRKSKFTKEQDDMIVDLKNKGKSWADIAQIAGVGSFLAARNRYQVLIGQQGVGSSVWGVSDSQNLQSLVDEGEIEKWRFIAREMYKLTGKSFTDVQCRELIRKLFLQDPTEFGVDEGVLKEYDSSVMGTSDHNIAGSSNQYSVQQQSEHGVEEQNHHRHHHNHNQQQQHLHQSSGQYQDDYEY